MSTNKLAAKKWLGRTGLGLLSAVAVIAGIGAFSAFEAHIVNVTARIENALAVSEGPLAFGTVFPQEFLVRGLEIRLSDSFLEEDRVDDIEYVIKQKPKVKDCDPIAGPPPPLPPPVEPTPPPVEPTPPPVEPTPPPAPGAMEDGSSWVASLLGIKTAHAQTAPCGPEDPNSNPVPGDPYAIIDVPAPYDFNGVAWQFCEENLPQDIDPATPFYNVDLTDVYWRFCYLPLANSLSKHKADTDEGGNPEGDTEIDAFHQAYVWDDETGQSSLNPEFIAVGRLAKSTSDLEDSWIIDLKVPCFVNHCAQEAFDPENEVGDETPGFHVPAEFQLDPTTEHLVFGTDLWIEVTGVSLRPEDGTLVVNKVVVNDNQGTAVASDFSFMVDGGAATPFEADGSNEITPIVSGEHIVAEPPVAGYTATFSGDCDENGNVTVPASGSATCTITNNDNPPEIGTLTVNKEVTNNNGGTKVDADFLLNVSGTAVVDGVAHDFAPGSYNVAEAGLFGYSATFSGDCAADGTITIADGDNLTCTITNDDIAPTITLVKVPVGGTALPDDFDLTVDGSIVTSGASTPVSANAPHALNESSVEGYTFTSITGSSFLGVACPAVLDGTVTLEPGDVVTCTITNTFGEL